MKEVQIYFNPEVHKYTDHEGNAYTSVTQLIEKYSPHFDKVYWAYYVVVDKVYGHYGIKQDLPNQRIWFKTSHTCLGMFVTIAELQSGKLSLTQLVQELRHQWKTITDAACERGSNEHNYLEDCINAFYEGQATTETLGVHELPSFKYKIVNEVELYNSPLKESHPSILEMLISLVNKGFTIYAEKRCYSYEHKVCGTIDILAVNSKRQFYIIDWKTNKDELHFESGYYKKERQPDGSKVRTSEWVKKDSRLLYPISDLQDCKGSKYTLQLSLYAKICEMWGLQCLGLLLVHIRIEPMVNGGIKKHDPLFYEIKYLKEHVTKLLNLQIK